MSQEIGTSEITIKKLSPKTGSFVNFEIEREGWSLYRIEDRTLLRARFILTGVLMEGKLEEMVEQLKPGQKPKLGLFLRSRRVFTAESPLELRGNPDSKAYTTTELKSSITNEDMDFETIREVWNLYKLENGITLKARLSAVTINKTNKFESAGMPIYTIDSNVDVKIELPSHIQKILEEKRRKSG
jgi:hypothetical protein